MLSLSCTGAVGIGAVHNRLRRQKVGSIEYVDSLHFSAINLLCQSEVCNGFGSETRPVKAN